MIPMSGPPPPYLVEETDRSISLLVYGVTGAPVISMMTEPADPYFNSISSTPEPSRVRYSINLNHPPYGYLALWQNDTLTFRVRRPPRIADAASPLRGLTVTVDPGHPPAGATAFYSRVAGSSLNIAVADLATNWTDVDGDVVGFAAVSVSTNGVILTDNSGTLNVTIRAK